MTMRALVSSDLPVVGYGIPTNRSCTSKSGSKRKRQPTPPSSN